MNESPFSVAGLDPDLVERYLQRRLDPAAEAAFEELLLAHPEAALEVEAAQQLQSGLREVIAEDAPVAPPRLAGFGRFLPLVAAALLLLAFLPYFFAQRQIVGLEAELEASRRGPSQVSFFSLSAQRGGEGPRLSAASADELLVFALETGAAGGATYRARLLAEDGREILSRGGLAPDPLGRLLVAVPARLLAPGVVDFRVETAEEPAREVGRFRLTYSGAPAP